MTGKLFLQAVRLCLSASIVTGVVLLLRLVLKKAPRAIVCALWILVGLRLVIPAMPKSSVSVIPEAVSGGEAVEALEKQFVEETTVIREDQNAVLYREITAQYRELPVYQEAGTRYVVVVRLAPALPSASDTVSASDYAPPKTFGDSVVPTLSIIWLAGIGIMLLYMAWSYLKIRRRLRTAVIREDGVWESDAITSPFILGLVRPRIYLPTSLSEDEAAFVLAHERMHLRRGDQIWKPLGFVLLAVYWFNPLFWLAYFLLCRDIESACDEKVIRAQDAAYRKAYSATLLALNIRERTVSACPLAFAENGVKSRIKSVLNYRKPAFWLLAAALVISLVAAGCALTDPTKKESTEPGRETTESAEQTENSTEEADESVDDDSKAYLANEKIYSSFDIDVNTGIYICPDDFAGTAIDGINGQTFLRLYLKQPDEAAKARWLELAGEYASVLQIQEVKYSYNELQQMVDELAAGLREKGCVIYACSVDIPNNGFNFATSNEYLETVKNEICAKYPDIPLNLEYRDQGPEATDLRQLLSNKTFVWEKPGAGSKFYISLAENGHFEYFEGVFSSFIGMGDWSLDGNTLTLTMDARLPAKQFRFTAWQNELFFIADESDQFTYVRVMDGDRFILSDNYIPVGGLEQGAETKPLSGRYHLTGKKYTEGFLTFDFEKMTFRFGVSTPASSRSLYTGGMFIDNGILYAVDNDGYIPDGFVPDRADMESRLSKEYPRFVFRIIDEKTLEFVESFSDMLEVRKREVKDKDLLVWQDPLPSETDPSESTVPETEPAEINPAEPVSSSEIYTFADGEIFDYIGEWEGKKYFLISFLLSADGLSEAELGQGLNMTAVGVAEASKNGGEIQVLTELGRYIYSYEGVSRIRDGVLYIGTQEGYIAVTPNGEAKTLVSKNNFWPHQSAGDILLYSRGEVESKDDKGSIHQTVSQTLEAYDIRTGTTTGYGSFICYVDNSDDGSSAVTGTRLYTASAIDDRGFWYVTGGEWTEVWYQPFDGGEPEQFGEATKWQHYYVAGTEDFRVDISYTGKSTTHMDVFFNDSADSMRSDSAAPDYSTIHAVQSADGVWHFSSLTQWFDIDAAKKTLVVYTINNRTSSDWKPFAWDENGTDIVLLSSDQRSMLFAPGESGTEDTEGTPVEDFHVICSSNLEDRARQLGLSPALEAVGSGPVFQLDSVEDKEFFWSVFREDKEPLGSHYPGLAASMSAYDSAFFRDHVLLAISWKTGMSYFTEEEFRVSQVVSDHTLHLRIGLEYPAGKGFSAMVQHYWIFVPVSRSEMADVTAFDATWASQSLPPDWTEPVNPDWKKEGVLYLPLGS